ncbi:methylase [Polyplosphaeria fusca]|uniref:Methylase n=1 Tax=Polyplosphaeria fusca TaxID=682080 RepID=A0A9P4R7F1_9PLEO|nr:methylase [Polyplosphaeria fusca]
MAQTEAIYDRQSFFDSYLELPRSRKGLGGAPEWPTLRDMVGSIDGQVILDLGCGLGWFSRYAIEAGASASQASDVSRRMIERAQEMTPKDMNIGYSIQDLNTISLAPDTYDLAYSSLALHYLPNESFHRLVLEIYQSLKAGGQFVFSVEHPIYTSPSKAELENLPDGREIWPLDSYGKEDVRRTDWMGGVTKYHRTIQTHLKGLMNAGFVIRDFVEWLASAEDVTMYPGWRIERERPMFLLIKVYKP